MSNDPTDESEASDDQTVTVDEAEVIRRLDNLWMSRQSDAAGLFVDPVGTTVGRYVLERIIGRGAFGVVYKAYDPALNRAVAIKIPRPDVLLDSDRLARFESEVQACARLDHPGIVPLYEADLSRAIPFMSSAYCPGPNLQQWMDESASPYAVDAVVSFIEKVARAVQYAHEHGVVHRDLKPGNILLVPNDSETSSLTTLNDFQPRLTDFGLAQITHGLHETQSSLIIGTPLYMSPEQAESRSDDIGPGSDIFGLGAILYHLLTGVAPFAARNYAAVLSRLREDCVVPVSAIRPDADGDLETVCLKCLQRDPADRYSSAGEFADDLLRYMNQQSILGKPMSQTRRFQHWMHQTARLYEATLLIIVLACIRIFFGPGGLMMIMMSTDVVYTHQESFEALLAHLFVTVPMDAWMIWAARRNLSLRASRGVYAIAFGISVSCCLMTLLIALGILPATQWYQRTQGARVLVFSFIALTYFVQSLAWYVADWQRMEKDRVKQSKCRLRLKIAMISLPMIVLIVVPVIRKVVSISERP